MSARQTDHTQVVAAAKAGISERTGRKIDQGKRPKQKEKRTGRTRPDPLIDVWESELVPLLESTPELQPITLLEYLQEKYQSKYPNGLLRTMQRRVKQWRAVHGPEKAIIFRQEHPPGRQGLSDFTSLKGITITIQGESLKHLLYHFRLAYSGWSHLKVILGGESFTAFAEGLQEALWRLGGVPLEHRTDSLSAAFKNLSKDEEEDITERYEQLCKDYGMVASRNNRGKGHENGSIESAHGHIKRRIKQALLLRQSNDFESLEAYQAWLDEVVRQHNRRHAKNGDIERGHLQPLPAAKSVDFTEVCARVSSSSTIDVRRTTYTVPSRLEGESLRIKLYHDRLECYLGATHVITLSRIYPVGKNMRARKVDYRHVIGSLVKKPGAFRYSQLRDDLLPNDKYKQIWKYAQAHMQSKAACRYIVNCLYLAAVYDCESALADAVLANIKTHHVPSINALQQCYGKAAETPPTVSVVQHDLSSYDALISNSRKEMVHA